MSNDLEPVEAEAKDNIGFTQVEEMDNVIENGVEDNDLFVSNARKCHNSSISTSHYTAKNRSNMNRTLIGAVETIANDNVRTHQQMF